MPNHYRTNRPRFVDETVEGEALVMDMVKGNYYSCVGPSAFVWKALTTGWSTDDVAQMVGERYGIGGGEATRDVDRFVESLLHEEMLVAVEGPGDLTADRAALDAAVPVGEYSELVLERFTDLADLILLDPVHDVSEVGWPHAGSQG